MINQFRGEYDWASNFYFKAGFTVNGQVFKSSEHYFSANKTADPHWQLRILSAFKASEAKKLGKQCPIRPDWHHIRVWTMANGLLHKFSQNADILAKLLATGEQGMIEGNYWHDNFWGDCMCNNKLGTHPECLKVGNNVLGKLLINLRTYYRTIQLTQGA